MFKYFMRNAARQIKGTIIKYVCIQQTYENKQKIETTNVN